MSQPTEIANPNATQAEITPSRIRPYRLSVTQYLKMIAAGVFPESAQVELLGGILVEQMTKGDSHDYLVMILPTTLQAVIPGPWVVVVEVSLRLGPRSRPEPDIMILEGPIPRYKGQPPQPRNVGLIVEVADTSYADDRSIKWTRYAAAGIPVYWIINLNKRQVEVYRDPTGRGKQATYQTTEIYGETTTVPVVIAGVAVGRINVGEILP